MMNSVSVRRREKERRSPMRSHHVAFVLVVFALSLLLWFLKTPLVLIDRVAASVGDSR